MSARVGTAYLDIKPDWSGLNREIAKHGPAAARAFNTQFGKALAPVAAQQQKHLESAWRGIKVGAIAGAAGVAYALKDVVETGAAFEKQMSVNAAVSDANTKQLAKLEKQSIKLGKATFYSASQAAEAQGELIKGGLSIQKVIGGGLPAALNLAEAGQLELAVAAETTVNAMKLFGLSGKEAGAVADMLATAANRTTADVEDFAMALKQGGGVAKLAGYDMNNTVTVLEAMAEAGVKNSDAGTSMKNAIIQLLKPSTKQADLQKELNLQLIDQNGNLKDAAGLSEELQRATGNMTKAERAKTLATLAGTDGVRALNALYAEGPEKLRALERANAKQGTAQEVAAKKMNNLAGEFEQFKGSVETAEISIYKGMAPALKDLAHEATGAANRIGSIFENPNLSGSQKIERSLQLIDHELGRLWDENDMTDHLVDVLDKAVPIIAEHAGHLGFEFAKGFVHGFIHGSPLTKAVMAAWAINFIGGRAAFVGAAKFAAKQFGIAFAAESAAMSAATPVAASALPTAAATAAGSRWLGTEASQTAFLKNQGLTVRGGGAFGEQRLLEDAGLIGATSVSSKVKGLLSKGMTAIGGVAGGYFAAEFGAKVVEGITGADLLENQDLRTALTHGFNTKGVLATEVNALQEARGFNPELSEAQIKSLEQHFRKTLGKIKADAVVGLSGINHALRTGLKQADQLWQHDTAPWRQHTAKAMQAAVDEIHQGIHEGIIPVEQGRKRINALLEKIELRKGSDPFGLARATADSFRQAGGITQAGVRDWAKKLSQMPHIAREQSKDATIAMLSAWAQGHPKIEAQIASLTQYITRKFGGSGKTVAQSQQLAMRHVSEATTGASTSVAESLSTIGANLTSALQALGQHNLPQFKITMEAQSHHHPQFKQRGGEIAGTFTVPGHGSGDKVPLMLPPGSFIENREAATRLAFQHGGLTPVIAEPNERVWLPPAVDRVGLANLQARNAAIPRFQGGGVTGTLPHPLISGPDPLRAGAQHGVDLTWKAAEKYLRRHMEPPRVLRMLRFAEAQAAKGYPYVFGGGHGSFAGPYDCSGYVSAILHAGGFLDAPMSVQQGSGLYTLGQAGPGKFFTWGVRGTSGANAHTMIEVDAPGGKEHFFESGGSGGGAHETSGWDGAFQFRHMPGYQKGGPVGIPEKAQEVIARYGQKAFDPKDPHFVGWGYQRGGRVLRLASGGFVGNINHTYPQHWAPDYGGTKLPDYVIAALAEAAGAPGRTMQQVTLGESGGRPGSAGVDPNGKTKGYGLWAITSPYSDSIVGALGGYDQMFNPVKNAAAMAKIYASQGLGAWYGTSHVTADGAHYTGNYDIRHALGGATYKQALEGKAPSGKESDEHSFKEDVPATFHGLQTGSLHFPSVPNNLKGVDREIDRWSTERRRYSTAIKAARKANKPAVVQALEHNRADIENHLRELRNEKVKLRREEAKKRFTKRLARRFAKLTGMETTIEAAQRAYEKHGQFAEQVVALEPTQPEIPGQGSGESDKAYEERREAAERAYVASLTAYIEGQERPAYQRVLESEADWRNVILSAQAAAAGNWQQQNFLGGMEGSLEGRIVDLVQNEGLIETFARNALAQIEAWRNAHPNASGLPEALKTLREQRKKALEKLPFLQFKENELRKTLGEVRGLFYPGKAGGGVQGAEKVYHLLSNPAVPLPGSGSFEESLKDVQGLHWPEQHEFLGSLPGSRVAGHFGGAIWDTQTAIEELRLKISEAASSIEGAGGGGTADETKSELTELEREELLHFRQREAIKAALEPVLEQFKWTYPMTELMPPYAGKAHTGAIVPGPPSQEKTMVVRGREGIFTEQQMAALAPASEGAGAPVIESLVIHPDDSATMRYGGREFETAVREVVRGTPRALATGGAGRAFRP